MAQLTGIFETLVVPAGIEAAKALRYTKAAISSIFWGYRSTHGTIGQTMNINIPVVNQGNVSDIGSGAIKPMPRDHNTVPIVLGLHPSNSFPIQNWDQVRTPIELQELYMEPAMEELLRQCNSYVTSLFTAANFNSNPTVTSTVANEFARADLAGMWGTLTNLGVRTDDVRNLQFLTNPISYATMFADTSFYSAQIVGEDEAKRVQHMALVAPQLNATLKFDQQMTPVGGKYPGVFFHRFAVAGVTVIPPANDTGGFVKETFLTPFPEVPGFRIQLQMWYDPNAQGHMIHMHAMLGVKLVRPEMGVYGLTL
jgi:hypothetical protein